MLAIIIRNNKNVVTYLSLLNRSLAKKTQKCLIFGIINNKTL